MDKKVCIHPLIPMRSQPNHRSEQVSQILFGETSVIKNKDKEWIEIETDFDKYIGWVEEKALANYSESQEKGPFQIVSRPLIILNKGDQNVFIPAGSEIPALDAEGKFTISGKSFSPQDNLSSLKGTDSESIIATSRQFLNAPYLWGGRTVFGIDCSGFVQIVYKINGINLPRDTRDQVKAGTEVQELASVQQGDLLFFTNKESEISHVGIYLGHDKIIHASLFVRIDFIDSKGIYNADLKAYTHDLYTIRRFI